jgi:hypothetical protein
MAGVDDRITGVDPEALLSAIRRVLARRPGSTAREILGLLPDDVKRRVARRDVNSVLYKGAGGTFIRSDEEKPRWRLAGTAGASPRPEGATGPSGPPSRRSAQKAVITESSDPPRDAPAAAEDAPEVRDIARILFDD